MYVANDASFVPLCAFFLSLLEGGANGIDDTAAHFAEVRVLRDYGTNRMGKGTKIKYAIISCVCLFLGCFFKRNFLFLCLLFH